MKTSTLFVLLIALCITGCLNKKIEITPEYILNENWGRQPNSMVLEKMKVKKDSVINPFLDLSQKDIANKLEEDSLFKWYADLRLGKEQDYGHKKVYFDKDNGFNWRDGITGRETRVFGNLEKKTWYKFSELMPYAYFVYVYVDSTNQLHRFDVNQANY